MGFGELFRNSMRECAFQTWVFAVIPLLFLSYWLAWVVYARTLHPLASIPGPFWASLSRTWYMRRAYDGNIEVVQRELHARLGPIVRIAPDEVSISDPSAIPLVYRSQKPLQKTDYYLVYRNTDITKQPDMFTSIDESEHSRYRRIVNPAYLMSSVLKSEGAIDECTTLFLRRLGRFADSKQKMDFGEWLEM